MPNLTLVTAPTLLPVSAEQVMQAAAIEDEAEIDRFERLIRTATELVQDYAGVQLLQATYRLDLSHWNLNEGLILPRSNRGEITHVKYLPASGGSLTTWAAEQYQFVSRTNGLSELWPLNGVSWPSILSATVNAVQVTYKCGAEEVDDLPPQAVTAVEQMALYLYEHPAGSCDLPAGIQTLIRAFWLRSARLDRQMGEESL